MTEKNPDIAPTKPRLGCCQGNSSFAISIALLAIRLVLGWTFIFHGSQKLFGAFGGLGMGGNDMEIFAQGLKDMPLLPPKVWAYMAAGGEFFGGLSIFLGLLARLGAIPIIITMFVAIKLVLGPNGFGTHFDAATKQLVLGYEFNVALIAMALAILLAGPGLISFDALLFKRGLWSFGPQPLSQPHPRQT